MFYGDRRTVAADPGCLTVFGGNPAECVPIISQLQKLFRQSGPAAPAGIQDICGALPIDVVVAKDTDAAWSDRGSWVWKDRPIYANQYWRMFGCQAFRASTAAVHVNRN
jgi:hypothetical protein